MTTRMKIPESAQFVASILLAAVTCILFFTGGVGAVGGWLLGCIISTVSLAFFGARRRVLFTAIAVLPPFAVITASNLYDSITDSSAWVTPREMLSTSAIAFWWFVALPLLVAFGITYVTRESRNA